MKKTITLTILLLLTYCVLSQTKNTNLPSARIECGPWLQAVGETEFTVVWTTTVKSAVWVEIAPDDGSHFYAKERPKFYQSEYGRRPVSTLHQVKVSGLKKGTSYRYRIFQQALLSDEGNKRVILGETYGSDILKHQPYKVTTLDEAKKDCKFSMVNDIHGNDSIFRDLMKNMSKSNNDFIVFNGDMLTQIESRKQIIDGYLKSAGELFSGNIPLYAIRGNHENRGSASYDFMKFFPTSTNLPYFTVKQGPAFIIFLDSGEDKPDSDIRYYGLSLTDQMREEEAAWLKNVVESEEFKQSPIKIVVIHMPPMPQGWYGVREVDRLFTPILNNAGIDLMLCGHLHKLQYIEQGKQGNNFPILINSNKHRVDLTATEKGINIDIIDKDGKKTESRQISK